MTLIQKKCPFHNNKTHVLLIPCMYVIYTFHRTGKPGYLGQLTKRANGTGTKSQITVDVHDNHSEGNTQ